MCKLSLHEELPAFTLLNGAIFAYPLTDIHPSIVFETTQINRIFLARSTKIYSAWSREMLVSLLSLASPALLVPLWSLEAEGPWE